MKFAKVRGKTIKTTPGVQHHENFYLLASSKDFANHVWTQCPVRGRQLSHGPGVPGEEVVVTALL